MAVRATCTVEDGFADSLLDGHPEFKIAFEGVCQQSGKAAAKAFLWRHLDFVAVSAPKCGLGVTIDVRVTYPEESEWHKRRAA